MNKQIVRKWQLPVARRLLLLGVACLFNIAVTFGQSASEQSGLSTQELGSVVQQCISLPALEKYLPKGASGLPVNIVQSPVTFPADLALSSGRSVNLLPREQKATTEQYFQFRTIEQSNNTLKVVVNYFYKGAAQSRKMVAAEIELAKSGNTWSIVNNSTKELL